MIYDANIIALGFLVVPVAMFSRRNVAHHNRGRIAPDDGAGTAFGSLPGFLQKDSVTGFLQKDTGSDFIQKGV